MVVRLKDPADYVSNRVREIQTMDSSDVFDPDDQELAEREEAAQAYAGESEQHFVDFYEDAVKESVRSKSDVRKEQEICWRTFREKEPRAYANKEPWQSRVIIPKPNSSVLFGAATVKKAFSPQFLTIEKSDKDMKRKFWSVVLNTVLSKNFANFPIKYLDALVMALAVGESLEMIPKYQSKSGLSFDLVEPWKIQRDPDAPARDPQGGLYWIHQEWLDYHVLKEGEKSGQYFQVERARDLSTSSNSDSNPFMSREAVARRKEHIWHRTTYRTMILTGEFWGTVLSPKGELLLKNATYTVAGGRVIQLPTRSPYDRLRWPGVAFSPLPDILKFGGRGLLQGVVRIWETMCNLLCLHEDYLKWIVNPSKEINVDGLVDPTDTEDLPGKEFLTRDTPNGQKVVRLNDRRDTTGTVLGNLQYHDQIYQHGVMVTDAVQGLPGWRQDQTARESAQNLEQSMGVFSLMGDNMEEGACQAIYAVYDTLKTFAAIEDYAAILEQSAEPVPPELVTMVQQGVIPELAGRVSVSGMEALMKDQESLRSLMQYMFPMASTPEFSVYTEPYNFLKAIERRANLKDEKVLVSEDRAKLIKTMQDQALFGIGGEGPPPAA